MSKAKVFGPWCGLGCFFYDQYWLNDNDGSAHTCSLKSTTIIPDESLAVDPATNQLARCPQCLADNPVEYCRPKTRGELVRQLEKGVACEVVKSNTKITALLIDSWFEEKPEFSIRDSENDGWSVFEPKPKSTDPEPKQGGVSDET